jgi:hypothetical protein
MVSQDKSMEAMIQNDEEKEWMQPLLDIRNDLDIENDRDRRDFRRLGGNVQLLSATSMARSPSNRFLALILKNGGKHGSCEFSRHKQKFVTMVRKMCVTLL